MPTFGEDEEVSMWMTIKNSWWQTLTTESAITGGSISNEKITPSSSTGGVIYYTLNASDLKTITGTDGIFLQGYGLKITSIQVVSGS